MEYTWCTLLKRSEFEECTPRQFYEQYDIYCKINDVGENSSKEKPKKKQSIENIL